MCGRFVRTCDTEAIVQQFDAEASGVDIAPSYNIAPSQLVAVIVNDGGRRIVLCKWGFIPHWADGKTVVNKQINARAETVAQLPSFSTAFKRHRCLIVANGFYEWRRDGLKKTPVLIRVNDSAPFGFAGLYSTRETADGGVLVTCAVITTAANALVGKIHNRMPVIIHREDYGVWLGRESNGLNDITGLLRPYPDDEMSAVDVSHLVNSPKNNSPQCIEPV